MGFKQKTKSNKIGYLFALPYFIHFAVFTAFPITFSFLLIFHQWDIISPMKWVALKNFNRLFQDLLFFKSLINTGFFLLIHIPLQIIVALLLAELLNQKIRLRGFFRASFFMPVVVSGVVITILWQQLYAHDSGVLNNLLTTLGLRKLPWLTSTKLAMPSIAIMATWKNVGLYVVLFLVGLQTVPKYLYEAADIEGASEWQKFRHITLPMINPTMILVVIVSTIGGFSLFIEPYIMTGGGPMNSTLSAMLYIYQQAFSFYHMGYAATLGFFFAAVVLSVVLIQKKLFQTEVHY
ncbi:MAG TPA: sugar ABC transporter permease [bacterium]|nr:sugar ABC transporter permease [bacterium]